jgi:hypothetical protein
LSIKSLSDGRVLIKCFAGCGIHDVLSRIGLDMEALFPPRQGYGMGHAAPKRVSLLSKGQALEMLESEALFVAIVAANLSHGTPVEEKDRERLSKAFGRISYLASEARS